MKLHGLLFELGIIKKTLKKIVFKLDKLKQVLHLLVDTKMYAANFVGDYDTLRRQNREHGTLIPFPLVDSELFHWQLQINQFWII